jgi:vacuolar protein-sorting-associated protein 4
LAEKLGSLQKGSRHECERLGFKVFLIELSN